MPIHRNTTDLPTLIGILAVITLVACASPNAPAPSHLEIAPEGGFAITQDVRVGVTARTAFERGVRELEANQAAAAIEAFLEVTEAAPQVAAAHINLGIAYGKLADWEDARLSLGQAVSLSPRHPVAHNELGIALRHLGRFEEARDHYESALDVAPEFHPARRNLAILCDLFLEDTACALNHYERYAASVPSDPNIKIWVTDLQRRSGR